MDENVTFPEEKRPTNKERLQELDNEIAASVPDLFTGENYRRFLRTMARHHGYSANNSVLIHLHRPTASQLATFDKWESLGRHVSKDEHGIKIIAPDSFMKTVEVMQRDPQTRMPLADENGEVIMEKREVKVPYYTVKTVFDVTQTYGEPLKQRASDLSASVRQFDIFMGAVRRSLPVPLSMGTPAADSPFRVEDRRITIRGGMDQEQTARAAVEGITQFRLRNRKDRLDDRKYPRGELFGKPVLFTKERLDARKLPYGLHLYTLAGTPDDPRTPATLERRSASNRVGSVISAEKIAFPEEGGLPLDGAWKLTGRGTDIKTFLSETQPAQTSRNLSAEEIEAMSIAYAVCDHYGVAPDDFDFDKITAWAAERDVDELRASLDTITRSASGLIYNIDRNFEAICQERGIDRAADDVLFLLDNDRYLSVERFDGGWSYGYTVYDKESKAVLDEGLEDLDEDSPLLCASMEEIAGDLAAVNGIEFSTITPVSMDIMPAIIEANRYVPAAEEQTASAPETQEEISATAPAPEPKQPPAEASVAALPLDEYPLPNRELNHEVIEGDKYKNLDLLPVTREQAHEFLDQDMSVYYVAPDGTSELCFDHNDIDAAPPDNHIAILGEEWEKSSAFRESVQERMEHQAEREAAFTAHLGDSFAIYQLNDTAEARDRAFMDSEWLEGQGLTPDKGTYNLIYTAELGTKSLEDIFHEFNMERPADFGGHSLSVSDIVAVNHGGNVTYHYCDAVGFKELPGFGKDNPLKNAEMAVEDDYGMIDGIINNGEKQPAAEEKRPSVLAMLKQPVPGQSQPKNTAPKKSAEMEI